MVFILDKEISPNAFLDSVSNLMTSVEEPILHPEIKITDNKNKAKIFISYFITPFVRIILAYKVDSPEAITAKAFFARS